MLPKIQENPDFVEMFLDEARLAAMLSHPNVVQIFDLGQIDGRYFIAMEYLAGESLSTVIRETHKAKKRVPVDLAAGIVMQAADGLHYAHTATDRDGNPLGVVHRDISPQNISVLYGGGVKVVDFGVAKATGRGSRTRTGVLKGKVGYMSPEQIKSQELDARSDVFSLGVVLWETLTGRRLFRGEGEYQLMQAIAETDAPSPLTVRKDIPQRLAEIAQKALARDRDQRYGSAAEMRAELATDLRGRAAEADSAAISRYMRELFAERMQVKQELIKRARESPDQEAPAISGEWRPRGETQTPSVPAATPPRSAPSLEAALESTVAIQRAEVAASASTDAARGAGDARAGAHPTPIRAPLTTARRLVVAIAVAGGAIAAWLLVTVLWSTPAPGSDLDAATSVAAIASAPADGALATVVRSAADAAPAAADSSRALVAARDAARPTRDATTRPKIERSAAAQKIRERESTGSLRLSTTPWAIIYFKGKSIGESPLIDVQLPAGRHRLRAVNQQVGIDTWIEVEIKPGERTAKSVQLR